MSVSAITLACNLCSQMFGSRESAGRHCAANPTHHVRVVEQGATRVAPRTERRRRMREDNTPDGRYNS